MPNDQSAVGAMARVGETLRPFFRTAVEAFENRDLEALARIVQTPTTIYFRDRILFVENRESLLNVLQVYCDNLQARNYFRTNCDIMNEFAAGPGRMCVEMQCTHYDSAGTVISTIRGLYYCTRTTGGRWAISLLEYDRSPKGVLTKGLSLS